MAGDGLGIWAAILWGMTIRVGTIQEMTGEGFEFLVDEETRSVLIAKFFDGNMITGTTQSLEQESPTLVTTAE